MPQTGTSALANFASQISGEKLDVSFADDPVGGSASQTPDVILPNGEPYFARPVEGTTDLELIVQAIAAQLPVALLSVPGTGKSALLRAAAVRIREHQANGTLAWRGPDEEPWQLFEISCSEGMTEDALIGRWVPNGATGSYDWVEDHTVTAALRGGHGVTLAEVNSAAPAVVTRLNNLLDGSGRLVLQEKGGEVVHARPGAWQAIDFNPGVAGFELSPALESRFGLQIEVRTNFDAAAQRGIDPRAIQVARELNDLMDNGEVDWAPQMRELVKFQQIADVYGSTVAVRNLVGIAKRKEIGDILAERLDDAFTVGMGTHCLEIR